MPRKPVSQCEIRYTLSSWQAKTVLNEISRRMKPDEHCKDLQSYSVYNVYYDSFFGVQGRRCNTAHEQLMIRSYEPFYSTKSVFLQLKKGCNTVKRVEMGLEDAVEFIKTGTCPCGDVGDMLEISKYICSHSLRPSVFLCYDRLAFDSKCNKPLRVTLDSRLCTRRSDFFTDANCETDGHSFYMHIKTKNGIPDWLSASLCDLGIHRTSFTKQLASFYI